MKRFQLQEAVGRTLSHYNIQSGKKAMMEEEVELKGVLSVVSKSGLLRDTPPGLTRSSSGKRGRKSVNWSSSSSVDHPPYLRDVHGGEIGRAHV